jgi:hypothetical protein
MRGAWSLLVLGCLVACGGVPGEVPGGVPVHEQQESSETSQGSGIDGTFTVSLRKMYGFCAEDCDRSVRGV